MNLQALILTAVLLISTSVFSQEDWRLFPAGKKSESIRSRPADTLTADTTARSPVSVQYVFPNGLTELMTRYQSNQEKHLELSGYRIQVFTASGPNSKTKARKAQLKFDNEYPFLASYLKYQTPNFEIRVGDFRTRMEAERFLQMVKSSYPYAFIKKDFIELPPIEGIEIPEEE